MEKHLETIRHLRLKATRYYWLCQFTSFLTLTRIANEMEHAYKMATQEDIS